MSELAAAIRNIPLPTAMARLPLQRGFPVPWFVAKVGDEYDFRVVAGGKLAQAVKRHLCWLCGQPIGRLRASVIGPMCAVTRVTSEPPCHPLCAHYAVRACPFLANPRARRNDVKALPEERQEGAGLPIDRNPGVAVIWQSLADGKPFQPPLGNPGILFDLPRPHRVEWWAHGREATREECETSLASGLPALAKVAAQDGREALMELAAQLHRARQLLPGGVR
jgi:hypothetical protein